ncbi:MAG: MBL fold metallo-hydrolase [Clostridia bacterium]|nr:MBL fold metallo-hydrolase [Clostridia bacterium]
MKITYIGQMCYLIEAGGMRIVTDPYLSYAVDNKDEGIARKYAPPYTLAELAPDMIVISHPHIDHLDPQTLAPFYRLRRRSFTLVPASCAEEIAKIGGEPVPMSAPEPAKLGESFRLGGVIITAIPCAHTELHRDADGDYIELSYLIEAEGKKVFFGGDMSMYDGLLEALCEMSPDVMLLPVNGSDWFRTSRNIIGNLDSNEAAELAARVGTRMFIPGHHDLYDFNGCPNEWIEFSADKFGAPLHRLEPCESVEV